MINSCENQNIQSYTELITPDKLAEQLPSNKTMETWVMNTRNEISDIINGRSHKKLFIIGPCSVHNLSEALEYGEKLAVLAAEVRDKILIVMRVYFEKPRTTIGWKGLINDPDLDNSCDVNKGLFIARHLLLELNKMGLPCGYEVLDTITPQYISELISWGAVGARTTESQIHRQLVSGLSMPVGFKNATSGRIKGAVDGILSAAYPHCFMGITQKGVPAICKTRGNRNCHLILRGGENGPNYHDEDIVRAEKLLEKNNLPVCIMVDCSHGNSGKDYKNQNVVLRSVINSERKSVKGVMLESNLCEGKQPLVHEKGVAPLKKGVSITDSCIGFEETRKLVMECYKVFEKKALPRKAI
jgi:3-deoxy-7-phosphoheptulonate synthase